MKKLLIISLAIIVIIALAVNLSIINNKKEIDKSNNTLSTSFLGQNETNITSNITAYECLDNSYCAFNQSCINTNCTLLNCSSCQYIENHSCVSWQCCADSDCSANQKCIQNRCITTNCNNDFECAGNRVCSKYECTNVTSLAFETIEQGPGDYGEGIKRTLDQQIIDHGFTGVYFITDYPQWEDFTKKIFKNSTTFTDFENYSIIAVISYWTANTNISIQDINLSKNEIIIGIVGSGGGKMYRNDAWHVIKINKSDLNIKKDRVISIYDPIVWMEKRLHSIQLSI